ncbi:hypothetical protein TRVL_04588 [Trypanosoma vivax]|nr:hypothetical protein TRVL_04588 [Trypanosoma vivax]
MATVANLTPEQELDILKIILQLRSLGDVKSSERLRAKVRQCLLESADDDVAIEAADTLLRHYRKVVKKLDGTYEEERELKRLRNEQGARRASMFVDDQAESGEEDESVEDEEDFDDDEEEVRATEDSKENEEGK